MLGNTKRTKVQLSAECAHACTDGSFPHVAKRVERQPDPRAVINVENAPHGEGGQREEVHEHRVALRAEPPEEVAVAVAARDGYTTRGPFNGI